MSVCWSSGLGAVGAARRPARPCSVRSGLHALRHVPRAACAHCNTARIFAGVHTPCGATPLASAPHTLTPPLPRAPCRYILHLHSHFVLRVTRIVPLPPAGTSLTWGHRPTASAAHAMRWWMPCTGCCRRRSSRCCSRGHVGGIACCRFGLQRGGAQSAVIGAVGDIACCRFALLRGGTHGVVVCCP